MRFLPLAVACFLLSRLHAADFTLQATPTTVAWGYYSQEAKPVLTVHTGDTVRIQTASSCPSPARMEAAGVAPADIPQYERDIYEQVKDKGPGRPHSDRPGGDYRGGAGRRVGSANQED